jgi:hypothetical protein
MPETDESHKLKLRQEEKFFPGNPEFSVTFLPFLNHLSDASLIVRRKMAGPRPTASGLGKAAP